MICFGKTKCTSEKGLLFFVMQRTPGDHAGRFLTLSLELKCMGTSSRGQKKEKKTFVFPGLNKLWPTYDKSHCNKIMIMKITEMMMMRMTLNAFESVCQMI